MSSRQQAQRLVLAGALALTLTAVVGCASYKGPKDSAPAVGTATLADTYWKLMSVDGVEVLTAADSREAHVILRPDHRVTGFGSCNVFNGSWQEEDGKIAIGPLAATKMACPDLNVEQKMVGALDGEVLTEIDGTTLYLTGADGTELVFEARYAR